jgi:hypothetical protein
MTSQRARAYGRVTRTLRDLGPAKLLPAEQARIRNAADTLVFCADLDSCPAARAELADLYTLRDHLVASGRWTPERASRLLDDVWACGPGLDVPLAAAA